jgi:hypothetical protein
MRARNVRQTNAVGFGTALPARDFENCEWITVNECRPWLQSLQATGIPVPRSLQLYLEACRRGVPLKISGFAYLMVGRSIIHNWPPVF